MAVRVKPIQATVVRSEKIIRQIIAEVRRKPSTRRLAEIKKQDAIFSNMIKGIDG
ncbi:MAG: hypothetical protein LBH25_05615 [Fibromonadaceae bacterium]|jgi:hypothetical protein|nr:hypothetical protein [Fibromonadaceae bacterium]